MTDGPLVIAVPSKGRLQENAAAFFRRAGLPVSQAKGARDYRGSLGGVPDAEIAFMSAGEIVTQLASGAVHLGVTGEDIVRENVPDAGERLELLTPLGFGFANVVVAVPDSWIDVRTMADLDEVADEIRLRHGRRMRVATKYANLTRSFFAANAVGDYRIVESLGATEAAPQAGTADVIVDITTTGATLAANGLKVLEDGIMLRSEANLVASLRAPWSDGARRTARIVLSRIAAEEAARTTREVSAAIAPEEPVLSDLVERHGATLAAGGPGLTLHCPEPGVFALVEALLLAGAEHVSVRSMDFLFRTVDPLSDRLLARLPPLASAPHSP